MKSENSFDIVFPVLNAQRIVRGALESLVDQTFSDFRVIVIDGASKDGTLEIVQSFQDRLNLWIISEQDKSLSDAISKGLSFSTASYLGILAADERYEKESLAIASQYFSKNPDVVLVTGRTRLLKNSSNGKEEVMGDFSPEEFDLQKHLSCEIVWPISATFFSRSQLGQDLRYENSVATCPDYELWARLGSRFSKDQFLRVNSLMSRVFATQDSMSFNPIYFEAMVNDKIEHLDNLIQKSLSRSLVSYDEARAGINLWAAEQLLSMGAELDLILPFCREAFRLNGLSARMDKFIRRCGMLILQRNEQGVLDFVPRIGTGMRFVVTDKFELKNIARTSGANVRGRGPWKFSTSKVPWTYSVEVTLGNPIYEHAAELWLEVDLEVSSGAVGVGVLEMGVLRGEKIVGAEHGRILLQFPYFLEVPPDKLIFRSGGGGYAKLVLYSIKLCKSS